MVEVDEVAAGRTCYRHPNRPAPLACSRCGRPVCLDEAIDAPVGFLCPEDAEAPPAQRRATVRARRAGRPPATIGLIGIMAAVYVGQLVTGDQLTLDFGLFGPAVASGQWWRLVTSGFSHGSLIHIGFNAYLAWMLGSMLEPVTGTPRYLGIYLAGLFGGSAGALLLSYDALTIGASGAVFGLMGAAMVGLRSRGVNPWTTQIGSLLALNLVFTFVWGNISVGGHLGGLLGGALAGWVVFRVGMDDRAGLGVWGVTAALAVLSLLIGLLRWTLNIGL